MWKYRFIVHEDKLTGEVTFIASEVHFNENRTPKGYTEAKIIAESYIDTIWILSEIQSAIHKEKYYAAPDFPKIYEKEMPQGKKLKKTN